MHRTLDLQGHFTSPITTWIWHVHRLCPRDAVGEEQCGDAEEEASSPSIGLFAVDFLVAGGGVGDGAIGEGGGDWPAVG
jgi:hypothetical protein